MAIDFPSNPTAGQQVTVGDVTWQYVNSRWEVYKTPTTTDVVTEGTNNLYFTDVRAKNAAADALADGTHTNITVDYDTNTKAISITAAPGYTDEQAVDAFADVFQNGSGILSTYDDAGNTFTVAVDTNFVATREYADQLIENLVDAAPTTLDTLNELAAALGDDSNYAATITSALGQKAPLQSPTFTGTVTLPNDTVTNDMLVNDAITINGNAVALGGTVNLATTAYSNGTDTANSNKVYYNNSGVLPTGGSLLAGDIYIQY